MTLVEAWKNRKEIVAICPRMPEWLDAQDARIEAEKANLVIAEYERGVCVGQEVLDRFHSQNAEDGSCKYREDCKVIDDVHKAGQAAVRAEVLKVLDEFASMIPKDGTEAIILGEIRARYEKEAGK